MFGLEMEDINGQTNIMEKWVILHSLCQRAIIVKEDMIWLHILVKCTFDWYGCMMDWSMYAEADTRSVNLNEVRLPHAATDSATDIQRPII